MTDQYYFAYGSNMASERMRSRISQAILIGAARLKGLKMVFTKLSSDGSAKCDMLPKDGAEIWGVLYLN